MFSSGFNNPGRSLLGDDIWTGSSMLDPWASFGSDVLPLTGFPVSRGSQMRQRSSGRLMSVDALEDNNEFKVNCEVS